MSAFEISPNGKWIAYTGREVDAAEDRAKREKRDFRVIDDAPKNARLWIAPADPEKRTLREFGLRAL